MRVLSFYEQLTIKMKTNAFEAELNEQGSNKDLLKNEGHCIDSPRRINDIPF